MDAHTQLCERFRSLRAAQASEFEVAAAVATAVDIGCDATALRGRFKGFVAPLVAAHPGPDDFLDWFRQAGFSGPTTAGVSDDHSNIAWVMDQREGIPISISILLIEAARACGLGCYGVNFPGYFLIDLGGRLADPLRLQWVGSDDLERADEADIAPASGQTIGLRMLNNLKAIAGSTNDWAKVLNLLDYQLELAGTNGQHLASLHYERGEAWENLGAVSIARDAYLECVSHSGRQGPRGELRRKAQNKADDLMYVDDTLH